MNIEDILADHKLLKNQMRKHPHAKARKRSYLSRYALVFGYRSYPALRHRLITHVTNMRRYKNLLRRMGK